MTVRNVVVKHLYRDSVQLMELSERLRGVKGVEDAAIVLGTNLNKRLLAERGMLTTEGEGAEEDDVIIAIKGEESAVEAAIANARNELEQSPTIEGVGVFSDLEDVLRSRDIALASISVAGKYVGEIAEELLKRGVNLFIFSDHVPLDVEVRLKKLGAERGLLVMGPEAGTSMLSGVGLGFYNEIRSGPVGIVGATGSGMQELSTLLDRAGVGVSHMIGVGGRDVRDEVGAIMTVKALKLLDEDGSTKVIGIVSKKPGTKALRAIEKFVERNVSKPVFACFLGAKVESRSIDYSSNISALALKLIAAIDSELASRRLAEIRLEAEKLSAMIRRVGTKSSGALMGFYAGGALASETLQIWRGLGIKVRSNLSGDQGRLEGENVVIDYGAEEYTEGRAHPIIDPTLRDERVVKELERGLAKAIVVDAFTGAGAPKDSLSQLAKRLSGVVEYLRETLTVVHVVGSERDPQSGQVRELERLPIVLASSNAIAAITAAAVGTGRIGELPVLADELIGGDASGRAVAEG